MDIFGSLIFLSLVSAVQSSSAEMAMNDFEIIDGIYIPKERTALDDKIIEKDVSDKVTENQEPENQDDIDDDDDDDEKVYDDFLTDKDTAEENEELIKHLPTDCHSKY